MTGLRNYAPHKLDAVPPCNPALFAFKAHGACVDWLRKWFPGADVVDIHRSKSVCRDFQRGSEECLRKLGVTTTCNEVKL